MRLSAAQSRLLFSERVRPLGPIEGCSLGQPTRLAMLASFPPVRGLNLGPAEPLLEGEDQQSPRPHQRGTSRLEMEARNARGYFAVRVVGRWCVVPTSLYDKFRRQGGITQD